MIVNPKTHKKDPMLTAVFAVLFLVTVFAFYNIACATNIVEDETPQIESSPSPSPTPSDDEIETDFAYGKVGP